VPEALACQVSFLPLMFLIVPPSRPCEGEGHSLLCPDLGTRQASAAHGVIQQNLHHKEMVRHKHPQGLQMYVLQLTWIILGSAASEVEAALVCRSFLPAKALGYSESRAQVSSCLLVPGD
jgi:hypothetical protein